MVAIVCFHCRIFPHFQLALKGNAEPCVSRHLPPHCHFIVVSFPYYFAYLLLLWAHFEHDVEVKRNVYGNSRMKATFSGAFCSVFSRKKKGRKRRKKEKGGIFVFSGVLRPLRPIKKTGEKKKDSVFSIFLSFESFDSKLHSRQWRKRSYGVWDWRAQEAMLADTTGAYFWCLLIFSRQHSIGPSAVCWHLVGSVLPRRFG